MTNPRNNNSQDDLQGYTSRLDDLETFKSEYEGVKFYKKIKDAIKESKTVEKEIKLLVWQTVKEKVVWIIIGVVLFLATVFLKDFVSTLAQRTATAITTQTNVQAE